jgi:PAS domain S-box-containing protein
MNIEDKLKTAIEKLSPKQKEKILDLILSDTIGSENVENTCSLVKSVISSAHEGIIVYDTEFRYVEWNPFMEQLAGLKKQDVLGKSAFELFPHLKEQGIDKLLEQALAGETVSAADMYYHVPLTGKTGWTSGTYSPLKSLQGDIIGVLGIVQDITELKKREQQLQSKTALLKSIIDGTSDAIYIKDFEGKYILFNEGASQITGKPADEVMGKDDTFLFSPEESAAVMDADRKVMESGKVSTFEEMVTTAAGDVHTYLSTKGPVFDSEGSVIGLFGVARDITDRKKIEEDLAKSEVKFRTIFDKSTTGKSLTSPAGKLLEVNNAFASMLGYTVDEMQNVDFRQITHPDDVAESSELIRCLLANERETYNLEKRYFHKNGSIVWASVSTTFLRDENLTPLYLITSIIDITERKQAEKELRFTNTILSTQSEASLDGILVIDEKGKVVSFNNKFIEIWGIPNDVIASRSDELALKSVLDKLVSPEEFLTRVSYLYQHRNEKSKEEVALRDKRILDRYSAPLIGTDGNYYGRVWYFRDITDHKQAELALKESEEKYKHLFDFANDAIIMADAETGIIIDVNKKAEEITGKTKSELVGINRQELHPAEHSEKHAAQFSYHVEKGNVHDLVEIVKKDGTLLYAEVSASKINLKGRNVMMGVFRDITERKKAEESLNIYQEKLRQSDKLASIGQLAGGVAHDFRNALSGMIGFTEIVLRTDSGLSPETRNRLEKVMRAGENAANVAKNLLAFSRKGKYKLEVIELDSLVSNCSQILNPVVDKRISIATTYKSRGIKIMGDGENITTALLNLGINARDAMSEGGKLEFVLEQVSSRDIAERNILDVDFKEDSLEYACIEVSDSGMGIDKEVMKHLFEPYFTTKGDKGTGLGLASVFGIIKSHYGYIDVKSEIGKGTSVFMYLPLTENNKGAESSKLYVKGTGNILVIDDDENVRLVLHDMIESMGYKSKVADNGPCGVELLKKSNDFELIFLDMNMPVQSGQKTFQQIREISSSVPIIVCSGYSDDEKGINKILESARTDYLAKPFTIEHVSEMLAKYVRK